MVATGNRRKKCSYIEHGSFCQNWARYGGTGRDVGASSVAERCTETRTGILHKYLSKIIIYKQNNVCRTYNVDNFARYYYTRVIQLVDNSFYYLSMLSSFGTQTYTILYWSVVRGGYDRSCTTTCDRPAPLSVYKVLESYFSYYLRFFFRHRAYEIIIML